jgi:hypothetical protein
LDGLPHLDLYFVAIGVLQRVDGQQLSLVEVLGGLEPQWMRPDQPEFDFEDHEEILEDIGYRANSLLGSMDDVVLIVVGFEDGQCHKEHLDTDEKVLSRGRLTSTQYISFLE